MCAARFHSKDSDFKAHKLNFIMIPIACSIRENQEIQALWGDTGFLQWECRHEMHLSVYEQR